MKKTIALCLVLLLCVTTLPTYTAATDLGPSPWALEEVNRAISMGFVPARLQSDYQKDITRDEFAELAVSFCESQLGYAYGIDYFLQDYRNYHMDADGNKVQAVSEAFSDATPYGTVASALGITNGKGEGKFDPDGSITRQEAAAMLLRTYTAYSSNIPSETIGAENYTDNDNFPSWAADSIMRLKSWSVMKGDGNNAFNPAGHFTREQSILTFLRLDQYAPYSRSMGNLKPLLSYKESIRRILSPVDGTSFVLTARYDKPDATILSGTEQSADGKTVSRLWVVYTGTSDIGQKDLYPSAAKNFPSFYTIDDISFDNSNTTMYYTVNTGEIQIRYGFQLNYVYAVPETSQARAQKLQQLPTVFDSLDVTGFDGEYIYTVTSDGKPCVYTLLGIQLLIGDAGSFSQAGEGIFALRSSMGVTYYTVQGTKLNHTPYAAGTDFYGGIAAVQEKAFGQITIIDRAGAEKKAVNSQESNITASSFEENCVCLTTAGGTNFLLNVDTGAKTSPKYIDVLPFSNGYAAVHSQEDGWGYIKKDFSEAIACWYGAAKSFGSIIAPVANKELVYGAISPYKSQTVIPFEYKDITEFNPYGYALGERENGQCVLLSVEAPPVSLPTGNIYTFQIYGKYVVQEVSSGYIVLDSKGTSIFPDMNIQRVYGCFNAGNILIESEHHFFLQTN